MYIPPYVNNLISILESRGFEAYAVGGCVRDSLLGITPSDWDLCTSALPKEICDTFGMYKIIPTGIKHGTVTVITPEGCAEITTFRGDGVYKDRRHPGNVVFLDNLYEDLKRRDFTVNSIAYSPRTGITDMYGGINDLRDGILRCVGIPKERFAEDALRIMRALRFAAVYNMRIEEKTAAAIHEAKEFLLSVSAERIAEELKKLLSAEHPEGIVKEFFDVLNVIFDGSDASDTVRDTAADIVGKLPRDFCLRLCGILYTTKLCGSTDDEYVLFCKNAAKRLKADKRSQARIVRTASLSSAALPSSLAEARFFVKKYGTSGYEDAVVFQNAVNKNSRTEKALELLNHIKDNSVCCTIGGLAINGNDLIENKIAYGEKIGFVLDKVLEHVILYNSDNNRDLLLKIAEKYR